MDRISVEEYTASWHCPKCNCLGEDCDEGVDDDGDDFSVVCYECNHEYVVVK
ncbi:hypothetical protein NVP1100O_25 [Vibrio phage 1.100.O._10N.261.45.C3]|nr:hypothetical protein NVP1100O_25 [Vibrio phage 1.100.O._10N.261.45.C3]